MTETTVPYLPDQPSLRYPNTKEEREEKAKELLYLRLGAIVDELRDEYELTRDEAVAMIKEVFEEIKT